LAKEEHDQVLRDTLKYWSKQEHDIQLLSTEGYRIASHKKFLSFYSSQLKNILNEPEIALNSQIPILSLPASSLCISSMLSLLLTGKAEKASLQDVKQLATAVGINLKNCMVDKKSNINNLPGLTVVKVPENGGKSGILKPIVGKSSILKSATVNPLKNKAPTESILSMKEQLEKNGSGLRLELKGKEDLKSVKLENLSNITKKAKCFECDIVFKDLDFLSKHKEKKHGDSNTDQDVTENGNEKVECDVCHKHLSRKTIKKHRRNIHGLRKGRKVPGIANGDQMKVKVENDAKITNLSKQEKTFKCDKCPKSFGNGWELRQHQRIHLPDSEKPFECDICQKKFCQKGQRNIHMKNFHNMDESLDTKTIINEDQNVSESIVLDSGDDSEIETNQDETPSHDYCGYCGGLFSNEDELNNHIASAHV